MRPVNSKFFGSNAGRVRVRFNNGVGIVPGFIVKQVGSLRFMVSDGSVRRVCRLARTVSEFNTLPDGVVALRAVRATGGTGASFTPRWAAAGSVITNGGSGYSVGQTLTVVGGTGTATILTVVGTAGGGVITQVALTTDGLYTVLPGTAGAHAGVRTTTFTTNGGGTGFAGRVTYNLNSVVVAAAGTGYVVGDALSFSGSGIISATVSTVNGSGGVTAVAVATAPMTGITSTTLGVVGHPVVISRFYSKRCSDVAGSDYTWSLDTPTGTRVQFEFI
jgi:hypothetical protein